MRKKTIAVERSGTKRPYTDISESSSVLKYRRDNLCALVFSLEPATQYAALTLLVERCRLDAQGDLPGITNKETVSALHFSLGSINPEIRRLSIDGIGWLTKLPRMKDVLSSRAIGHAVMALFNYADTTTQKMAILLIAKLNSMNPYSGGSFFGSPEMASILRAALTDEDPWLRKSALFTIDALCRSSQNCMPLLFNNSETRQAVRYACACSPGDRQIMSMAQNVFHSLKNNSEVHPLIFAFDARLPASPDVFDSDDAQDNFLDSSVAELNPIDIEPVLASGFGTDVSEFSDLDDETLAFFDEPSLT